MKYRNARGFLPPELLFQIQKYCEGCVIYVPKRGKKAVWGKNNGTRRRYDERNTEIFRRYSSGIPVRELSAEYYLSEDSIRKIIREKKRRQSKKLKDE